MLQGKCCLQVLPSECKLSLKANILGMLGYMLGLNYYWKLYVRFKLLLKVIYKGCKAIPNLNSKEKWVYKQSI